MQYDEMVTVPKHHHRGRINNPSKSGISEKVPILANRVPYRGGQINAELGE
jgi:hypothetical protein